MHACVCMCVRIQVAAGRVCAMRLCARCVLACLVVALLWRLTRNRLRRRALRRRKHCAPCLGARRQCVCVCCSDGENVFIKETNTILTSATMRCAMRTKRNERNETEQQQQRTALALALAEAEAWVLTHTQRVSMYYTGQYSISSSS